MPKPKISKLTRGIVQAVHLLTRHRDIEWWIPLHDVLTQLGLEWDAKTVKAVQQAIDLQLLRADSRDDPGSVTITQEGRELAKRKRSRPNGNGA
jgi:hypothetical protein